MAWMYSKKWKAIEICVYPRGALWIGLTGTVQRVKWPRRELQRLHLLTSSPKHITITRGPTNTDPHHADGGRFLFIYLSILLIWAEKSVAHKQICCHLILCWGCWALFVGPSSLCVSYTPIFTVIQVCVNSGGGGGSRGWEVGVGVWGADSLCFCELLWHHQHNKQLKSVEGEKAIYSPTAEGDLPSPLIICVCMCVSVCVHVCVFSILQRPKGDLQSIHFLLYRLNHCKRMGITPNCHSMPNNLSVFAVYSTFTLTDWRAHTYTHTHEKHLKHQ